MANEILGNNQVRRNKRPEEIAVQFAETSGDLLETALVGSGLTALAKKKAPESVVAPVRSFLQKNPNLQNIAKNLTSVGSKATKVANVPLFAYTIADSSARELTGKGISERIGEGVAEELARNKYGDINKPAFNARELKAIEDGLNVNKPIFETQKRGGKKIVGYEPLSTAPTLQALAEQRAGTTLTEDDAVDSLQSAIKAAGEQNSNLSPDALQAIQPPVVPEYVTSSDPNAGAPISGEKGFTQPMGPMQFIDRETGEPLDPTVVQAAQEAGLTDRLAQGAFPLPETPEAPVSAPPMGVAETNQRLQSRFGAPTLRGIQALPSDDPRARGMQVDAQGRLASEDRGEYDLASAEMQARIAERDRRPGESQTERDTRIARGRTQGSVSESGKKYTDSQLRRLFPDKDDYQAARVKDMSGIDPLTNQDYQDQELDRRDTQSQIDARDRIDSDDPTQTIKDARAKAEEMARQSGLSEDDPDYNDYILDTIAQITDIPRYRKPIPTYPDDAAADAAYAAGQLKLGDDVNVNGVIGEYTGPKTEEDRGPRPARGRGGRPRPDKRNQEDQ